MPRSCTQPSMSALVILLGVVSTAWSASRNFDRCALVGDAGVSPGVVRIARAGRFEPVRPVVLGDDRSTALDIGEESIHFDSEVIAHVVGTDADNDAVEVLLVSLA